MRAKLSRVYVRIYTTALSVILYNTVGQLSTANLRFTLISNLRVWQGSGGWWVFFWGGGGGEKLHTHNPKSLSKLKSVN